MTVRFHDPRASAIARFMSYGFTCAITFTPSYNAYTSSVATSIFFFKQKTAYEI